jgi:hypothetical protein
MERETVSSTNQNQSKTLDRVISWMDLEITTKAYAYYLSSKGGAFLEVSRKAPEAIPSVLKLTYTLEEWSGCKNLLSLINDQGSLKYCRERYSLMDTIMRSIRQSLEERESLTSEQIKTLIGGLTTLQDGRILDNLYSLYEKTRYAAEVLEIVNSYHRDEIFISIISKYLRGFEEPFSEYVIKAQSDKIEMAAFKLLWNFERGCANK